MKTSFTFNKIIISVVGIIAVLFVSVFVYQSNDKKTVLTGSDLVDINHISPNYYDYSEIALDKTKNNGKTVLFFAATEWCNTCSALDDELKERSRELPDGISVLKIDYDRDKVNKDKYGIVQQHTMIILDTNGNETKRWIGGGFDTLVSQIN